MTVLDDVRAERYAMAVAAGEDQQAAFRAAFGTGDLVLFNQTRGRDDILNRIAELTAGRG